MSLVREAAALVHQGVGVQPCPAVGCPGHRGHGRPGGGGAGRGGGAGWAGSPVWTSAFPGARLSTPLFGTGPERAGVQAGSHSSGQSPEVPPRPAGAGGQGLRAEVRVLGGRCVPAQLVNHHAGEGFHFLSLARSMFLLPRKSAGYNSLFSTSAMADNG